MALISLAWLYTRTLPPIDNTYLAARRSGAALGDKGMIRGSRARRRPTAEPHRRSHRPGCCPGIWQNPRGLRGASSLSSARPINGMRCAATHTQDFHPLLPADLTPSLAVPRIGGSARELPGASSGTGFAGTSPRLRTRPDSLPPRLAAEDPTPVDVRSRAGRLCNLLGRRHWAPWTGAEKGVRPLVEAPAFLCAGRGLTPFSAATFSPQQRKDVHHGRQRH
jgi:hypothetical protein